MKTITIKVEVEIPDGATHYVGAFVDDQVPTFLKCNQIGVAGDHWFRWDYKTQQWVFFSHMPSAWAKPLKDIII